MNRKILSRLSIILVGLLLFGLFPSSALAADNEYVLTSVNHTAALKAVDVKETYTATLTVPNNYPSRTVNLGIGLDIQFNTEIYSSATAAFPSVTSAIATVDGDPITMKVVYQKKGSSVYYSTDYKLNVVREKLPPTFEGTILKSITFPGTVRLSAKDFTDLYKQNDGKQLASISISGSNPSFGKLKIDSSEYVMGNLIKLEDLEAGKLTYNATAAGTVSYIVKAYQSEDTKNPIGAVTLTIESKAPQDTDMKITVTTLQNTPLYFSSIDFADIFKKETGKTLAYVKFDLPNALNGKLYYNYGSSSNYEGIITTGTAYSATLLPYISYIPDSSFLGSVVIQFTGYTSEDIGYNGSLTIIVSNKKATVINYKTDKNSPLSFVASDFNKKSHEATGKDLSHVFFSQPVATKGTLYYKYESSSKYGALVKSDVSYHMGKEPLLNNVDFVPAKDYIGTVSIAYTGYNVEGTPFSGTVNITIEDPKFKDHYKDIVKKYPWAVDALQHLHENGIITDETLKKLRPNSSISRGDFILLVSLAFDLEPSWNDISKDKSKKLKDFFNSKDWKKWSKHFDWDDWEELFDRYDDDDDDDHKKGKDKRKDSQSKNKSNKNEKGNNGKGNNGKGNNGKNNICKGKGTDHHKLDNKYFSGNWFKFILSLKNKSMLKSSSKSSLSRQDAMVIIYEAMKESGISISGGTAKDLKSFKDYNKISNYARDPIAKLVKAGIVDGGGQKLNPNKSISQVEAYVLIYNAMKYADSSAK